MEDFLEWNNTDVRVCILASLTYYFVVWNLQCRIWASLIRIEALKGDKLDRSRYETFVSTFRIRVTKMRNELNARTLRLKQLYERMKNDCVANAVWVGVEKMDPQLSSKTILSTPMSSIQTNTQKRSMILLFQSDSGDITLQKRRSRRYGRTRRPSTTPISQI